MSFQMMKNRVTVYVEIVYWGGFSFWGKMDPFFSSLGTMLYQVHFFERNVKSRVCVSGGGFIYATTPVLKQLFVRKIF